MKSELKAYKVYTNYGDGSVIAFATSHSMAKSAAFGCDILSEDDWVDLRCHRVPDADKYADEFGAGALDNWDEKECRFYRSLGWVQFEMESEHCVDCDLSEWTEVPESKLNYGFDEEHPWRGVCDGCKADKSKTKTRPESGSQQPD